MDSIFPFSVCRVTSFNPRDLNVFQSKKISLLLSKLKRLEEQLEIRKQYLVDELYQYIGKVELHNWKKDVLIKLKRDVYNCRNIELDKRVECLISNKNVLANLKYFIQTIDERCSIQAEIYNEYNKSKMKSKKILLQYSKEPRLRNGILFSSEDLFRAINDLKNQNDESIIDNKKYDSVFHSVLNYLTRSATKTSPLSSFNVLTLTNISRLNSRNINTDIETKSLFKINNLLYLGLKEWIISSEVCLGKLKIFLNPTMLIRDNYFHYFRHDKNNEDFCKLKISNPQFIHLVDFLNNNQPTFSEFVLFLNNQMGIGLNSFEFANKLIESGIICIHFPFNIRSKDWIIDCINFLMDGDEENNVELIQLLKSIFELREKLQYVNIVDKRNELIEKLIVELHQTYCGFKGLNVSNLFYEDLVNLNYPTLDFSKLDNSFREIKLFSDVLFQFCFKCVNKKFIHDTFREKYGRKKISLLEYYEKIYLKDKVWEQAITYYLKKYQEIFAMFFKNILSGKKIYLRDYLSCFVRAPRADRASFDLFMQISDASRIVVNNILNASGLSITRLYSVFPDLVKMLDKYNTNVSKDSLIAELRDSSIHNSQIQIEIADVVIDVSQGTISSNHIPLNRLYLQPYENEIINLVDENNKRIIPIDFSMESLNRRSSLFRFINQFSDDNSEGLNTLREIYMNYAKAMSNDSDRLVVHLSRIYLVENVILERESWLFPKVFLLKMFNEIRKEESIYLWFDGWRIKHNIPHHGFITYRIVNNINFTKPQYIDFRSPVYFKQFYGKIISNTCCEIKFSELLPGFSDEENTNAWQKGYCKEFILNFDKTHNIYWYSPI